VAINKWFFTGAALVLAHGSVTAQSRSASGTVADPDVSGIASEAYVFGYPLVSTFMSKRVMTNVPRPENGRAPINQVANLFAYPTAAFKDVVAPNVNTLYSSMWLDVSKEPIVVHIPDTQDRYYVMEILDMWTNVIGAPGKRTTGTKAQDIAIVGPDWKGTMPAGITKVVNSTTNNVWVINRIQANGPKDYPIVNPMQRAITTTPLSSFGTRYTWPAGTVDPAVDTKTPVMEQVNSMTATQFFTTLANAMKENRPVAADSAIVGRMARIGLTPGSDFKPDAGITAGLDAGAKAGLQKMKDSVESVARNQNNWMSIVDCGKYGTQYLTRAIVTRLGLGCNLPQDAVYAMAIDDASGQKFSGASRYAITFPAGKEPPVKAFWSVTMYDDKNFLVANPINRSAVSSWMDLKKNPDGSTTIYVQQASPGADKESNWLPAPSAGFVLMLRMYWPEDSVISGAWTPPGVTKTN
jgi:hypothetical protein